MEIKIQDFFDNGELGKMSVEEQDIFEKCFLLNKENIQNLTDAVELVDNLNKIILWKTIY